MADLAKIVEELSSLTVLEAAETNDGSLMSIYTKEAKRTWLEKWGLVAVMLLILSSFTVSSQDDRKSRRLRQP